MHHEYRWLGVLAVANLCSLALAQTTTSSAPTAAHDPLVSEGIVAAPIEDVWRVFSTADGFKKLGVSQCDMELRVGGLIRTHYDLKGTLGDEGTIVNEILAFEPMRMLAIRIHKPPQSFPFSEATWKQTWSVTTLTPLDAARTHVRIAGLGYTDGEESSKMRKFFEAGNAWVIKYLQHEFDATAPPASGPAHAVNPLAPIVLERIVELPRSDAWETLATSAGWKRAMGVESSIELRPGGPFEIYFSMEPPAGQRGSEGCTVLSLVPEQMLSFNWNAPPSFAHARTKHTWVVIQFESLAANRTRVILIHQGFAEKGRENPQFTQEWERVRAYFAEAWPRVLSAAAAPRGG